MRAMSALSGLDVSVLQNLQPVRSAVSLMLVTGRGNLASLPSKRLSMCQAMRACKGMI